MHIKDLGPAPSEACIRLFKNQLHIITTSTTLDMDISRPLVVALIYTYWISAHSTQIQLKYELFNPSLICKRSITKSIVHIYTLCTYEVYALFRYLLKITVVPPSFMQISNHKHFTISHLHNTFVLLWTNVFFLTDSGLRNCFEDSLHARI